MAVSINEVAERARVSRSTVSQVLNENMAARISEQTRERVRQIADEMGYRPNAIARALTGKSTRTIGLLVANLHNSFFLQLFEAARSQLTHAGYGLYLDAGTVEERAARSLDILARFPLDGCLLWGDPQEHVTDYLGEIAAKTPTVYLGHPREDATDWVAFDLAGGMREMVETVVAQGHRRIAFGHPGAIEDARKDPRTKAYWSVMAEHSLPPELLLGENRFEGHHQGFGVGAEVAARETLPDAIVCYNDLFAIGLIAALERSGLRVPQDVSVTGFDGTLDGQYLSRPLTTLSADPKRFAETAINTLITAIDSRGVGSRIQTIVPVTLLPGATLGPKRIL